MWMVLTGNAKENAATVLFSWVEACDEIANLIWSSQYVFVAQVVVVGF
jgi:hypothetical protein